MNRRRSSLPYDAGGVGVRRRPIEDALCVLGLHVGVEGVGDGLVDAEAEQHVSHVCVGAVARVQARQVHCQLS